VGAEIAALTGFFGLTSAFALIGTALAAWMAWRIVEKAGLPGWTGLGAILLTLTGIGTIVPLILLWVFAFMRWPRDEAAPAIAPSRPGAPSPPNTPPPPASLPPPLHTLADRRIWRLTGMAGSNAVSIAIDGAASSYLLTGAAAMKPTDLSVPDPSVGQPHARLLSAGGRIGLEDLGTPGGTYIDGARLLPEHGPRDISAARSVRLGNVDLALSRG
jgi:hypothetical protein